MPTIYMTIPVFILDNTSTYCILAIPNTNLLNLIEIRRTKNGVHMFCMYTHYTWKKKITHFQIMENSWHSQCVLEVKWHIWLVTWLEAELSCRQFTSHCADLWVKLSMWQENKGYDSLLNRQLNTWVCFMSLYTCRQRHTYSPAYNPI